MANDDENDWCETKEDWCETCGTPMGVGSCDGCNAYACCCDDFEDCRDFCHHCGKELEDFSDMGCEYCDQRHPGFGVTP